MFKPYDYCVCAYCYLFFFTILTILKPKSKFEQIAIKMIEFNNRWFILSDTYSRKGIIEI